jgi:hypothetical protein
MRRALVRNIYTVTAAAVGLALLGIAAIDWVGYTVFVVSLRWR